MKKLLLLLVLFVSCSTPQDDVTVVIDCDCDRIVEKHTFNVVGTLQNPAIVYHTVYTTINDCTQIQRTKTFDTTNINLIPQLGDCK